MEKILGDIDLDGNHRLDYEEFLAATIHLHVLDREDIMLAAFQHFDKDNSGQITLQVCGKLCHHVQCDGNDSRHGQAITFSLVPLSVMSGALQLNISLP